MLAWVLKNLAVAARGKWGICLPEGFPYRLLLGKDNGISEQTKKTLMSEKVCADQPVTTILFHWGIF